MILGITGHRPDKAGVGYSIPNAFYDWIISETSVLIEDIKPSKILTGMAVGFDQWAAELAIKLNIPFTAVIPFVGQELFWNKEAQLHYRDLLSRADHIEIVSKGGFASWKMQARNKYIVDNSNMMLGLFNGSKGGTFNCLEYAKSKNITIKIVNPKSFKKC